MLSAPGWRGWTPTTLAGSRSLGILRALGDVLQGAGQSARGAEILPRPLAIADRLASADPGNAGWQRDLSVSDDRVGDVLVAQGICPRR